MPRPGLRPTTDRVRESAFNMLVSRADIEGMRVLDLYAGTGALGIEALSRGAMSCDFVERDRRTAELIGRNLDSLGIRGCSRIMVGDAVEMISTTAERYDMILADPPYASQAAAIVLRIVCERQLLCPGGILLLEFGGVRTVPCLPGLPLILERSFGDTSIALYRASPAETS